MFDPPAPYVPPPPPVRRRTGRTVLIVAGSLVGVLLLIGAIGAAAGLGKKPAATPGAAAATSSAPAASSAAGRPTGAKPSADKSASRTAAPAGPPADGGNYKTAAAVLAKLSAAGLACTAASPMAQGAATLFDPGATSLVTCTSPGGTAGDTQVAVFDTAAHLDAYERQIEGEVTSVPGGQLGGLNWVLESTPGYAAGAKAQLGGTLAVVGGTSGSPSG